MLWALACLHPQVELQVAAEPAPAVVRSPHHAARQHYVAGRLLAEQGDWEGAQASFERAVFFDGQSPEPVRQLGLAQWQVGDLAGAVASLERAVALGGGDRARADLCVVQVDAGGTPALWTAQGVGRWHRARCAWALDQVDQAEADLLAAVAADPGVVDAWSLLAQVTARSQHYATALDAVDAALAHDPWRVELLVWRAQVATGRDDPRALASWRQLDALGEPVLQELALASARLGGDPDLIPRLERAGLTEPLARQHLALGDPALALTLAGDCQVVAECQALQGDLDAALTTLAHCDSADRATRQLAHARWDPDQLDVLLQGTPDSPGLLRLRAERALASGDPAGALDAALSLDADDPLRPTLEGLAGVALGTPSTDVLALAHERQPGDPRVLVALGSARLRAGDPRGRDLIDRGMRYGTPADLQQWDLSPKGAP